MKILLVVLSLVLSSTLEAGVSQAKIHERFTNKLSQLASNILFNYSQNTNYTSIELQRIKANLQALAPDLTQPVIEKVITSLSCSQQLNVPHNKILTVIDYSIPANKKRMWVFDLAANKLLFYTYVSHGIKSGALTTQYFSNKNDSKASSIGVYKTEKSYYGREGISLRLDGLDPGFNTNAQNRAIVMHGGWYMDEHFIKKYGRSGRSWGCPAIPLEIIKPVVETIKENSLMVVYYPNDSWFLTSKFLNCPLITASTNAAFIMTKPLLEDQAIREPIIFADLNKNNRRDELDPVISVSADNYSRIFQRTPPLERMLRRQINNQEFIALSDGEFKQLITQSNLPVPLAANSLDEVFLVSAEVKNDRGYYKTEMKILPLGKLQQVVATNSSTQESTFNATFEKRPGISLRTTNQFIRWLGL